MFRGPHRTCVEANAGCTEILGRRSNGASPAAPVDTADGDDSKDVLNKDGKIVGLRGASDVNVLEAH